MARKNMFEGITPPPRPEGKGNDAIKPDPPKMPEVFQSTGPIAAIRNDLRSVGTRSVQDIDPNLIEDSGLKDRLEVLDGDIEALRESISKHGQQVPVLVRPHPQFSGRYQIVYGRRRLAAIRGLGTPIKALVRTLSDEEAVLAQGQENNLRKDPSFIEKALFAGDLEEAGYDARVVQEALNVNRSHTSHMRRVREAFPRQVLERIGAAPSVGWKRWYDLAGKIIEQRIDVSAVHPDPFPPTFTSDQRFSAWVKALPLATSETRKRAGTGATLLARDGSEIGSLEVGADKVALHLAAGQSDFADWLRQRADAFFRELHDEFLAQPRKKH